MSEFDAGEAVEQVSSSLTRFAESLNVIGEPITVGEKVVIPAVVARAGFGAGGGSGNCPSKDDQPAPGGSGGGGGGAVMITPIFLIVDAEGERLLTIPGAADVATTAVEKVKDTVTSFFARGKKEQDKEDEEEA